jgi:hypothetical protein
MRNDLLLEALEEHRRLWCKLKRKQIIFTCGADLKPYWPKVSVSAK